MPFPDTTAMASGTELLLLLLVAAKGMATLTAAHACSLLGQPFPPLLSAEGDINIGAVFSIHRKSLVKVHSYTSKPELMSCVRLVYRTTGYFSPGLKA